MAVEPIARAAKPDATSKFVTNHLANERTFLAYLRTAVSLMSFGIAINRFSFFLVQAKAMRGSQNLLTDMVHSAQVGIGMVIIGMVLLAWAAYRYTQVYRQIEFQTYYPQPRNILALAAVVLVSAAVGLVWLFMR